MQPVPEPGALRIPKERNHMLKLNDRITILDGAMGTMLQSAGLPLGKYPEALNLTHPEAVTAIHQAYAQAGANILYANTFGAVSYTHLYFLQWERQTVPTGSGHSYLL